MYGQGQEPQAGADAPGAAGAGGPGGGEAPSDGSGGDEGEVIDAEFEEKN